MRPRVADGLGSRGGAIEPAFGDVSQDLVLGQVRQTKTEGCSLELIDVVEHKVTFNSNIQGTRSLLEFPGVQATRAWQAQIDAVMGSQVLRNFRFHPRGKVTGWCILAPSTWVSCALSSGQL